MARRLCRRTPRGRPIPSQQRAAVLGVILAVWSFATEPLYGLVTQRRATWPIGEAVVFAPLALGLAVVSLRGGRRGLRGVAIASALLAAAEIPAGIFATRDPSLWWKLDPECGVVWCGLLHTLSHWSHVPLLTGIALAAWSATLEREPARPGR